MQVFNFFSLFWCENIFEHWKSCFWPAIGVNSTFLLVEIHNRGPPPIPFNDNHLTFFRFWLFLVLNTLPSLFSLSLIKLSYVFKPRKLYITAQSYSQCSHQRVTKRETKQDWSRLVSRTPHATWWFQLKLMYDIF